MPFIRSMEKRLADQMARDGINPKRRICPNCGESYSFGFFDLHWETGAGEFSGRWVCKKSVNTVEQN